MSRSCQWLDESIEPVHYHGRLYDNRLVARWAVFLDFYGWCYEYLKYWNQPSELVLRNVKIVVPHKGETSQIFYGQKLSILASEESNSFIWEKAAVMQRCRRHSLVVGDLPSGTTSKDVLQDLRSMTISHTFPDNGYEQTYHFFPGDGPVKDAMRIEPPFCLWAGDDYEPVIGIWHTKEGRGDGSPSKTLRAFDAARQARFEGEDVEEVMV